MKQSKTKRIALLGMLFALSIVLSFAESAIAPLLGLPPGVKPGLANIVVMYAMFFLGAKDAMALVVLKSLFGALTRGVMAGALSLGGGVLSLLAMLLLFWIFRKDKEPPYFILSVSGAIMHNLGQLLMLNLLFTQSIYTFYYAPVLLISGLVMGAVTALMLKTLMPALRRIL